MKHTLLLIMLALSLTTWGCSSKQNDLAKDQTEQAAGQSSDDSGLTPFQMKNGIGPVTTEVKVGAIDHDLAEKGKTLFEGKCSACHKIGKRYVGPDLQHVVSRRTPAYIMNMMMNPGEMIQKHPVAHQLLAQFMTPMTNQNVSEDQARAIVEYFRVVNQEKQVSQK